MWLDAQGASVAYTCIAGGSLHEHLCHWYDQDLRRWSMQEEEKEEEEEDAPQLNLHVPSKSHDPPPPIIVMEIARSKVIYWLVGV